jgi:hypothetical protein
MSFVSLMDQMLNALGAKFGYIEAFANFKKEFVKNKNDDDYVKDMVTKFTSQLIDIEEELLLETKILEEDKCPDCLKHMGVHEIVASPKLTANSRHYLFQYITGLLAHAKAYDPSKFTDISPPDAEETKSTKTPLPDVSEITKMLPKNVLDKVTNLAESYEKKNSDPSKFDFGSVMKDVMGTLDADDISGMVNSMGGMFNPGAEGNGMPDIGALMSMMQNMQNMQQCGP